jgi:hypothetical protein
LYSNKFFEDVIRIRIKSAWTTVDPKSSDSVLIRSRVELGMVAHICNLTYSGGRAKKDWGLRPAQAKSSRDPVSTDKTWA